MSDTATAPDADPDGEPEDEPRPRTIAVDGSAASGKSSIGRRLAQHLGYPFLDTGVMYRAVTHAALQRGVDVHDPESLTELANRLRIDITLAGGARDDSRICIDDSDVTGELRSPEVDDNVSLVSKVPGVRAALVRKQQDIAGQQPIVMAGRDIGTVVLPDADVKVYLDASLEERARRRFKDFEVSEHEVTEAEVMHDLRRRDQIDSEREVSPLKPAGDAVQISTDGLDVDGVFERVLEIVRALPC